MRRSRFLLYLALPATLLMAPLGLYAQTVSVHRIEILEKAIYQAQDIGDIHVGSTAAGEVDKLSGIQLLQRTAMIPMRLGVRFGFRYSVIGSPEGTEVPVRIVTIFPAPGLRNPKKAQVFHRDEYMSTRTLGGTSYTDYGFDSSWELVPGVWRFQVWYQDRMLTEQRFIVAKP